MANENGIISTSAESCINNRRNVASHQALAAKAASKAKEEIAGGESSKAKCQRRSGVSKWRNGERPGR
jgi:hypothetical protein